MNLSARRNDVQELLSRTVGVENVDLSELVLAHSDYPNVLPVIMASLHLEM
jgi:hypothetical protein